MVYRQMVCRPEGPRVEIDQLLAGAKLPPESGHGLLGDIRRIVVREAKADREAIEILPSSGVKRHNSTLKIRLIGGQDHGSRLQSHFLEHRIFDHGTHIDAA
jgi:hypothetical protein